MRTYRLLTILFITGLLAASCELQEPVRPSAGYSHFYVETEQPASSDPSTKTFADENGMVLWVNGDLVSVFNKKSYATKYRYDGGTGTTGGVLTEIPESGSATGTNVSHYYAVYPHETYNGLDNNENVISKIRNEQTWDYCSFGSGDNLMVAVSDDNKFQFKNVGGYIVLRLYGEGSVSSITLQGNNNEILAGDVKVTATIGGEPTVAMQKGSRYTTYKSVTLQCADPVELTGSTKDNPVEFWFVVPATAFTQGLSFVVTDPDGKTFEKSTSNEIVVQRSHSKPLKTQVDFTASMKVAFADANFKAYCVENFDTDGDGEISFAEAKAVTTIDVNTENIASLEGIEHFENLQRLTCKPAWTRGSDGSNGWHLYDSNGNEVVGLLTTLDLSKNTKLRSIKCIGNQLTSLDLSGATALTSLYCYYNQLTSLDVSQNTALTTLWCHSNQLTSLDVSHNTALKELRCNSNQLTSLDVSHNTALTLLYCGTNPLLTEIWLKTGQTISPFVYDANVAELKYRDQLQEESYEMIDLGLPSGIKWASKNIGSLRPSDIGGRYSWGELVTKDSYNWDTYRWYSNGSITKYNNTDEKTELDTDDDIAFQTLGGYWRMPSKENLHELMTCCTWAAEIFEGVNGFRVTGPNGNSIYLPCNGQLDPWSLNHTSSVMLWSRETESNLNAFRLIYDEFEQSVANVNTKRDGLCVRAVYNNTNP